MPAIQEKNKQEEKEFNISERLMKHFIDRMHENGSFFLYMQSMGLVRKHSHGQWSVVMMNPDSELAFRKKYIFKTPYEELDEMFKSNKIPFHVFRIIEKQAEKNMWSYIQGKANYSFNEKVYKLKSFPQLQ